MVTDAALCLKEIGQRILERRKKLGMTQEALAEKGDVTTPRRESEPCGRKTF